MYSSRNVTTLYHFGKFNGQALWKSINTRKSKDVFQLFTLSLNMGPLNYICISSIASKQCSNILHSKIMSGLKFLPISVHSLHFAVLFQISVCMYGRMHTSQEKSFSCCKDLSYVMTRGPLLWLKLVWPLVCLYRRIPNQYGDPALQVQVEIHFLVAMLFILNDAVPHLFEDGILSRQDSKETCCEELCEVTFMYLLTWQFCGRWGSLRWSTRNLDLWVGCRQVSHTSLVSGWSIGWGFCVAHV